MKKLKRRFELSDDLITRQNAAAIEHLEDQPMSVEQARYQIGKNRI